MHILNRFPFVIALLSLLGWLLSFVFRPPGKNLDPWLTAISLILGAVYWLWILVEVTRNPYMRRYQRTFWLILVISVPFFGALLYQFMHQKEDKIVT